MLKFLIAAVLAVLFATPAVAACNLPLDSLFWAECRQPQYVQPPDVPSPNAGQDDVDEPVQPRQQYYPRQYGQPRQQYMAPVQRQSSGYFEPLDIVEPTAVDENTVVINLAGRYLTYYGEAATELRGRRLSARDGIVWRNGTRYSIGIGREGFDKPTIGEYVVQRKAEWPRWYPPKAMQLRDPKAAKYPNGMAGGPDNPLGARALYLHNAVAQHGKPVGADSEFRIHGTNAKESIGTAASSGCFRMMNEDVEKLFERVPVGTKVVVVQNQYLAAR